MAGNITDSPEYRALADKAANGSLSESEKVQWAQLQQAVAFDKATAANAAQGFKNAHYWNKVTLLKLQAPPTAQATLLSSPPAAEKAATADTSGAEEARKRARLMVARGTLFNAPAGGLGGTTIPAGGATPSLGGGRTLLS